MSKTANFLRSYAHHGGARCLLALSLLLLVGCQSSNPEQTPTFRTYQHGVLWADDAYFKVQGFGSPRVGINPKGAEIESVTLAWGKAPLGYGGHFIYDDQSVWVPAEQAGVDPANTNFRIWTSRFDKHDISTDLDPPPKGAIVDGERFDYHFRVRYRHQGSDQVRVRSSPNQSVIVAPDGGRVVLKFDPQVSGQTPEISVGQEILLQVRLSTPSVVKRTAHLSASPANIIQFVDSTTGQPISNVTFEPQVTYRQLTVKAVSVTNTIQGHLVTIKGTSSGWATDEIQLKVNP